MTEPEPARFPFLHRFDPLRYPPNYLRCGIQESDVQAQVLAQLRMLGVLAFAVDAGAKMLRGRAYGALKRAGASTIALLGQTGVGMAGFADLVGVTPRGRAVFVEVKAPCWYGYPPRRRTGDLILRRPAGQPSEAQLLFLNAVYLSQAITGVAWGPGDVRLIWESCLEE